MPNNRTLSNMAFGLGLWAAVVCDRPAAAQDAPAPAPAAPAASPVAPPDGVTVHASKKSYDRAVQDFVTSSDAQTRIGQLPRWSDKICPRTMGLAPDLDAFVSKTVLDLAAKVGAPADVGKTCHPNLLIVFSPDPQALLDKVKRDKPVLLGFHYTDADAKKLAAVSHPIQAWYTTATEDYNGRVTTDAPQNDWTPTRSAEDVLDNGTAAEGSRLRSGLQSQFQSVLVMVDVPKIMGRDLGAVANYIAVLALTQATDLDGCRDLPSITELLSPSCPDSQIVLQATAADLAYLRGLYAVQTTLFGNLQQGAIVSDMKASLRNK